METLSLAAVCAVCSIASFYFGRKKAATDDAQEQGSFKTDLQYIKDSVKTCGESVSSLSSKLDAHSAQREQEYREMLVQNTQLSVKYDLLQQRVDSMEKEIARYHHG